MDKIYFYDNGVRNALINNFNSLQLRNDKGQVWENFLMAERMKANAYNESFVNSYFWRTYSGAELDLIEEKDGQLHGFEFKMKSKRVKAQTLGLKIIQTQLLNVLTQKIF